jgi:hypothetical protein
MKNQRDRPGEGTPKPQSADPGGEELADGEHLPERRHFTFAARWARKRELRSTRAMWATLGLDLVLLLLIVLMVWVAFRAWQ